MVDTHCHLNLDPLNTDISGHIDSATQVGITHFIVPGVDLDSSQTATAIARKFTGCHAAAGIHPHEASTLIGNSNLLDQWLSVLKSLAKDPKVVAIGECGLDYFHLQDNQDQLIAAQRQLFTAQLELARDLDLPLSIHVREAHQPALKLIDQFKPRAVLHCFSGDEPYLHSALDLGLYISFAGNVTFASAKPLHRLLKLVPPDRLLLETDAPYLNPHRGQWPNTPANIAETYRFVADFLGLSHEKLSTLTHQNARNLFRF
jgi:TatD DNase family protein